MNAAIGLLTVITGGNGVGKSNVYRARTPVARAKEPIQLVVWQLREVMLDEKYDRFPIRDVAGHV